MNEKGYLIICAVNGEADFQEALKSKNEIIFDLAPNIMSLAERVKKAHDAGKRYFVHIDLAHGIGKDESGILYIRGFGIDGIISTKTNMIKTANEIGLTTVQRFFIVDSRSIVSALEAIRTSKPDMIEVMPGIINKVIKKLRDELSIPIITGGLIETQDEVLSAVKSGATAVSTSAAALWN